MASFSILLFSSQQIVLVVADNMNSSKAKLKCYEGNTKVCGTFHVNIGKNGLGWGFEHMKRQDMQYKLAIVVDYNHKGIKGRGSCIFMHIQRTPDTPTVGCTSMSEQNIQKNAKWLDKKKNPILVQIPKKSAKEVIKLYPQLQNSQLLQ